MLDLVNNMPKSSLQYKEIVTYSCIGNYSLFNLSHKRSSNEQLGDAQDDVKCVDIHCIHGRVHQQI